MKTRTETVENLCNARYEIVRVEHVDTDKKNQTRYLAYHMDKTDEPAYAAFASAVADLNNATELQIAPVNSGAAGEAIEKLRTDSQVNVTVYMFGQWLNYNV